MDKLRALQLFITVSECESYAVAAKQIGSSPSTISKTISRLEQDLRFKLFQRTTRHLKLTREGEVYLELTRDLIAGLEKAEQEFQHNNDDVSGLIRINVPFDYGLLYIQPFLVEFHKSHPRIKIDICFDDRYVSSIPSNADILIRTGHLEESTMAVRKLSPMDFVICASPEYLKNNPHRITSDTLQSHPWIRFRLKNSGKIVPIMVFKNGGYQYLDPGQDFIIDNGLALAEMCVAGMGLSQMPHFLARNWLLSGKLLSVFPCHCPPSYGVYALYNDRKFLPKRYRAFIDELVAFVESRNEFPEHTWARGLPTLSN